MVAKDFIKKAICIEVDKTIEEALLIMIGENQLVLSVLDNNSFVGIIDYNELVLNINILKKDSLKSHILKEYSFFNDEANVYHIHDIISYNRQHEYPILSDGSFLGFLDIPKFLKYYASLV